jgi:hypothetical protein
MAGSITPAGSVLLGSKVRAVIVGSITTAGASPVVTDDDTGLSVPLPAALPVTVREDALPTTLDSVVRASVNGGPVETLVLALNAGGSPRWRRVNAGAFVTASDVLAGVVAVFVAPTIPTALPVPALPGA